LTLLIIDETSFTPDYTAYLVLLELVPEKIDFPWTMFIPAITGMGK